LKRVLRPGHRAIGNTDEAPEKATRKKSYASTKSASTGHFMGNAQKGLLRPPDLVRPPGRKEGEVQRGKKT